MGLLRVCDQFTFAGSVPRLVKEQLTEAVESIPSEIFFVDGQPSKREISDLDRELLSKLKERDWAPERNLRPFSDCRFEVDIASEKKQMLIEIEKGKLPRLELDIFKIASACRQEPERWKYGALVVPASYVQLPLAGRQTPFDYLKRLSALVQPVIRDFVGGILVVGYEDPRGPRAIRERKTTKTRQANRRSRSLKRNTGGDQRQLRFPLGDN